MNLNEINRDILKKIDDWDMEQNKKDFLKEALVLHYENRKNRENLREDYEKLIDKYYEG